MDARARFTEMRTLSFAATVFVSRAAATFHALPGIRRAPDVFATSAGVFKLDVQSADNAFAAHKAGNGATDATSIGHGGETRTLGGRCRSGD